MQRVRMTAPRPVDAEGRIPFSHVGHHQYRKDEATVRHRIHRAVATALTFCVAWAVTGCSPVVPYASPSDRFEALLAEEPSIQHFVLDQTRTGFLEPFSAYEYTVTTAPDFSSRELRELSRDLTDWITENYAPEDTRIHVRLRSGEKSVGLSSVNEDNNVRLELVETTMDTGLFAAVSLRAPWQGSELSDDDGNADLDLLVSPSDDSTPGSALISADALIKAVELPQSTSTVMTADLDEYSGYVGPPSPSTVGTNSAEPLPAEFAVCVNALFALTGVISFNVAIPASGFGNKLFVSTENEPTVQKSLAEQGCDQVLAPITYERE
jgi:hypothetical protein